KRAKWVDYSGPVTNDAAEGVTLMDHPSNPNHPTFFHVRNDGWMGASLTYDADRVIEPGKPLMLRYGLYVHAGAPAPEKLNRRWADFASLDLPSWPAKSLHAVGAPSAPMDDGIRHPLSGSGGEPFAVLDPHPGASTPSPGTPRH